MRILISMITIFILSGCSGNSHLFDKATNVITGNSSSTPTPPAYGDACRHPEASNYVAGVMTANAGPCNFEACPAADFVEFSKHEEYSHYTAQFGGVVTGNSALCLTEKEYGKGCCHQDAIDYIGPACSTPGPCRFEVCGDENYQEYFNGDHAFFLAYVAQHGGDVVSNNALCKTQKGGCTLNSPYVTNYDPTQTVEDGSCIFRGCNENTYSNYEQSFDDAYRNYINSLGGKPFTGQLISTCAGTSGCTSAAASNYNPNVTVDDGSCNIECCGLENHEFYDQYCNETIDAYKDLLTVFGVTASGKLENNKNCGKQFGCYYQKPPYVTNPMAGGSGCSLCAEDGSCNIRCCGDANATNYDPQCQGVISDYLSTLSQKGLAPSGNFDDKFNCNYPVPGCSFNNGYVSNYAPNVKEDGSCSISCCTQQGYENYDANCSAAINEYQAILQALGLSASGSIVTNANCGAPLGCAYEPASNDIPGSVENGTCNISCCATPGKANYDLNCQSKINTYLAQLQSMGIQGTGSIVNNFQCGPSLGCTYPGAMNPTAGAGQENGSCNILCCSDASKSDYNPNCQSMISGYQNLLSQAGLVATGQLNSNFCQGQDLGCSYNGASNYAANSQENGSCNIACCAQQGFENYDSSCQGKINTYNSILSGLGLGSTGTLNANHNCGPKLGCTSAAASNYDPSAQKDDGSCNIICNKCPAGSDQSATDTQCLAAQSAYQNLLAGMGLSSTGSISTTANNCPVLGCNLNSPYVDNFSGNVQENGSCNIKCCATEGYQNYDANCQTTVDSYTGSLSSLGLAPSGNIDTNHACGQPLGCAYNNASNYQPGSQENGSCNIECCATQGTSGYDPNCQSKIDTYNTILSGLGLTGSGSINNNFNCGQPLGCAFNNAAVSNYQAGHQENGSCNISCCSTQGTANYDANCQQAVDAYNAILSGLGLTGAGTIDTSANCGLTLGCAYGPASNDTSGVQENGSCNISCCATEGMSNYDPQCQTNIDAYNAILSGLGLSSSGSIDNNFNCGVPLGCAYQGSTNYQAGSQEDGSCNIECCSNQGSQNYDANCQGLIDGYTSGLATLGITPSGTVNNNHNCGLPLGCSDSDASNYQPNHSEDGSCVIKCCGTQGTVNYDSECSGKISDYLATLASLGLQPAPGALDDEHNCGAVLGCADSNGSNYQAGSQENGTCNFSCCATQGTENFDKSCQQEIDTYISALAGLGITYTGTAVNDHNCGEIIGCMVEEAENYNPNAGADPNHECVFAACNVPGSMNYDDDQDIRDAFEAYGHGTLQPADCGTPPGCNHPEAENYVEDSMEDGSCIFKGCNQTQYGNFNSDFDTMVQSYLASLSSGGITFTGQIISNDCSGLLGCNVPQANNYNPAATQDDGSCTFTGCTDENAENYNQTLDDIVTNYGSNVTLTDGCQYDPHYSCLCDSNGTAKPYNLAERDKTLIITDPNILNSLKNGHNGLVLNLGTLFSKVAKPTGPRSLLCEHNLINSYIESYRFKKGTTPGSNNIVKDLPKTADQIQRNWGTTGGTSNKFDINQSPFDLLAIIYRPDLKKFNSNGDVISHGEIRFIFWLDEITETINGSCTSSCSGGGGRYGGASCNVTCGQSQTITTTSPSMMILEYPLTGDFNWDYNWGLLKCLQGNDYKDQLVNLIQSSAFSYRPDQVRVNTLREADFDPDHKWSMFEVKPSAGTCSVFNRVKMPLTPTDRADTFPSPVSPIRAHRQIMSGTHSNNVKNAYWSQFNDIADPFKEYTIPSNDLSWGNGYDLGSNWAMEMKRKLGSQYTWKPYPQRDFALYRYNKNTCNGCHASNLSAGLDLTSAAMTNEYGPIPFATINQQNDFLHIHKDRTLSAFLQEDLGYRLEDHIMNLTENYCSLGETGYGIGSDVNVDVFNCNIDYNNDGELTQADFNSYQNLVNSYLAGNSCVTVIDVDGDGTVGTPEDASAFQALLGDNGASAAAQYAGACVDVTSQCNNPPTGSSDGGEGELSPTSGGSGGGGDCPAGSQTFVHGTTLFCVCEGVIISPKSVCESKDDRPLEDDGRDPSSSDDELSGGSRDGGADDESVCRDGFVFNSITGGCVERR